MREGAPLQHPLFPGTWVWLIAFPGCLVNGKPAVPVGSALPNSRNVVFIHIHAGARAILERNKVARLRSPSAENPAAHCADV